MVFIELRAFTKRLGELLDDASYAALQLELVRRPEAGALLVHGGGLRKIRWTVTGRGKRGGVRVIYYHRSEQGIFNLVAIYAKNEKEDLNPAEIANSGRN